MLTYNCPSLSEAANSYQQLWSPAQPHTFTVSPSPRCCLFKYNFLLPLDPPRCCFVHNLHLPITARALQIHAASSALAFHQPICLRRVINRQHHRCLNSMGGFFLLLLRADVLQSQNLPVVYSPKTFWWDSLSHIICCNKHLLYFMRLVSHDWTAESFDLAMNVYCTLPHWREKPDVSGC